MQADQHGGGDFGLGEESYTQQPDQAQDYFGTDAAAAGQMGDVSAPEATYLGSEAYSGTEAYSGAEGYSGASTEQGAVQATWEEVQQWADYYRQEGYSEADVQAWIASNYPQFGQQPSSQTDPAHVEDLAEAIAMEGVVRDQPPSNVQQPSTGVFHSYTKTVDSFYHFCRSVSGCLDRVHCEMYVYNMSMV